MTVIIIIIIIIINIIDVIIICELQSCSTTPHHHIRLLDRMTERI